jgi:acyl carrier protein
MRGQPVDMGELAQLIVDALSLEIPAVKIDPSAPLFYEGLGLDSIDALELALVVSKKYGFELRAEGPDGNKPFTSLAALSAHIASNRTR